MGADDERHMYGAETPRHDGAGAASFEAIVAGVSQLEPFSIRTESLPDGWLRVEPRGELDVATCDELQRRLIAALDETRCVVLDLCRIAFVDSTGLASIINAARHADHSGVKFEVALPLPAQARRLFALTGAGEWVRLRPAAQDMTPGA
jgi:anti-anti-sigma factor